MKLFKTTFVFLLICSLSTHFGFAQWGSKKVKGNQEVIEETRTLSAYAELAISGNFEVELVKGSPGQIKIIAESNLLEHIITEVKKGTLNIEVAKRINLNPNEKIQIIVPFDELKEISLAGSGSLSSKNTLEAKKLSIKLSGSGKMNLALNVSKSVNVSKSGSGDVQLEGKAKSLTLKSSGSGKFESKKLVVDKADIKLSGSGKVYITCKDEISAKVSGSGKVYYKGSPSKIDTSTKGSGKIEQL